MVIWRGDLSLLVFHYFSTTEKATIKGGGNSMKKLCLFMLLIILITSIQSPSAFAHTNNSEGYSLIEVNGNKLDYELNLDLTEHGHSMNKEMDNQQMFDTKKVQDYIN